MERFDEWDSFLCHHGIKGQKWGVRNYQNADGSLTAAGRDRYGGGKGFKGKGGRAKNASPKQSAKELKRAARKEKIQAALKNTLAKAKEAYKKRHPEKMTDEELQRRLNRLMLEKQYKDLSGMTDASDRNRRLRNLGFSTGEALIRVGETAVKTSMSINEHLFKSGADIAKNVSSRFSAEGAKGRAELVKAKNTSRRQKGKDLAAERERWKHEREVEESKRRWEREKKKKGIP